MTQGKKTKDSVTPPSAEQELIRRRYPTTPPPDGDVQNLLAYKETQLELHEAVLDGMQDGVIAMDYAFHMTYLNPAAKRLLGIHGRHAKEDSLLRYLREKEGLSAPLQPWIERKLRRGESIRRLPVVIGRGATPTGHAILSLSAIVREGVIVRMVAVLRDQTELERLNEQLERANTELLGKKEELERANRKLKELADYDEMTGVFNRRAFLERVAWEVSGARRRNAWLGLLYIDPNGFKPINDTYGHDAGDRVIRQFVSRLRETARAEDVVGRMGGDEFAVLLPDMTEELIERVAARYAQELSISLILDRLDGTSADHVTLTAAIGGVSFRGTLIVEADQLLKCADQAMYQSKKTKTPFCLFGKP